MESSQLPARSLCLSLYLSHTADGEFSVTGSKTSVPATIPRSLERSRLPVQKLQSQLPSLALEGIQMKDFTSEEAFVVKMQGSATSVDPQREIGLVPPEAEQSRGTSVYVDVRNLDKTWLDSIKKKVGVKPRRLKSSSTSEKCSIHRVPHPFRHHDAKIREPQVISIGPFHCDKRKGKLQAMEEHKWRYLQDILERNGDDFLERCLTSIKEHENEAREYYSEEIELDSNSFVEMLVLDACFIIELLCRECSEQHKDDPIFELDWLKDALVIDLIMQENQIPFFILERLFNLMNVSIPSSPEDGALHLFSDWGFLGKLMPDTRISDPKPKIHHLLHLLHTSLVFIDRNNPPWNNERFIPIQSASKLKEAGIRFKKGNDDCKLLDIKFQNGVIEIPQFVFEDRTSTIFFNLIAFEQSYGHCKKDITSYASFMDDLINTARDVEILCPKIMDCWLGSYEEVAAIFNDLGRGVNLPEDFYLLNVVKEINQYYGKFYPRTRATLKHDYCRTPWAVVSIIAATVLLLFTLGQFFFSAFPKFAFQKKGI